MSASGTDPVRLQQVERVIRVLAPMLNLLLAVGDRVSRLLEPDDPDYVTPRMASVGESAPRGLATPLRSTGARGAAREERR
jgi:hypothetical protein